MSYNETPTKGPAMFSKKRALQVQMVKAPKNETAPDEKKTCNHMSPEKIAKISKDFVTHVGIVVGAVIVTSAVTTAAAQIAVKRTPSKD